MKESDEIKAIRLKSYKKGKEHGIILGESQATRELTHKFIAIGVDLELINEVTGTPLKTLESIKRKQEKGVYS